MLVLILEEGQERDKLVDHRDPSAQKTSKIYKYNCSQKKAKAQKPEDMEKNVDGIMDEDGINQNNRPTSRMQLEKESHVELVQSLYKSVYQKNDNKR